MGNSNSSTTVSPDLIDTSASICEDTFKVDNINSYGRKHSSAKIQISSHDLCIRQKHRQSLHIPLETIRRYGLDGSIFILECGRRAPLGQARYAFRCKQAHRLVDCLDQRISAISKQIFEESPREFRTPSSSTLTNVSSTSQHHHRSGVQLRRRTQSDQGLRDQALSSILISSTSSSSISLHSEATYSYRNSEPSLSENYLTFDRMSDARESQHGEGQTRPFIARLKHPIERQITPDLNYMEFKAETAAVSPKEEDPSLESDSLIATKTTDSDSITDVSEQPLNRSRLVTLFRYHKPNTTQLSRPTTSSTAAYIYIDHEKTTTLKEVAKGRMQQQTSRRTDI